MTRDAVLDAYLVEGTDWDRDRAQQLARNALLAWRVAAAGWACAVASAAALGLLMPLKRVEPFVVRVDNTTGIVDVVPGYTGQEPIDEAVTRYFLGRYVSVCQRFLFATAESDYEECGAFNTPQMNQAWYALWTQTNPASPLNRHKDGSSVRVNIESISFLRRAGGAIDLAQVRFLKLERASDDAPDHASHWIATMQFAYGPPASDPRLRRWNPLGFKVAHFEPEPEVLPLPSATATAAGAQ